MNRHAKHLYLMILGSAVSLSPASPSYGQNFIGDALGQLIAPAVGPVLERAAGEIVVEGVRRGYENGKLLPRPGNRPGRRQPTYQPSPQPTYRPAPQPTYQPQPTETYAPVGSGSSQGQPAPEPPVVSPPENPIYSRPLVSPNLSPTDIALTHVVSSGPQFNLEVIRAEATEIAGQIDRAALQYFDLTLTDAGGAALRRDYRGLLSMPRPENARAALLVSHNTTLASLEDRESITSVFKAADAAERITALSMDSGHEKTMQSVDELRSQLTNLRGTIIAGDTLAVLAGRIKNVRNIAVLTELARVLGVERRDDLFARVSVAAEKSDAPTEAIAALLGVALGRTENMATDMQLPAGNPAVVLYNPDINPAPISFVCDDSLQLTLAPGQLVPLDQAFVVAFQTGKGSVKRYTINNGMYRWAIDDGGWDLRQKTSAQLVLDASHLPVAFHYQLNGQPQVLEPGSVIEHTLDGPPRIDFDLGLGNGSTKSTLVTPGHYIVGVNSDTAGWDLHQKPRADSMGTAAEVTTASIAKEHWRQSVTRAQQASLADPAEAKVDALLNAIE